MTDTNPKQQDTHPKQQDTQDLLQQADEHAADPRDLVSKGGYRKHPRQIVENPAVTPQMLDEPQESRAGFIREDRDEADQSPS